MTSSTDRDILDGLQEFNDAIENEEKVYGMGYQKKKKIKKRFGIECQFLKKSWLTRRTTTWKVCRWYSKESGRGQALIALTKNKSYLDIKFRCVDR